MFKVSSYTHSFSSECHVKISLIKIDIKLEELNLLMFQKLVFCANPPVNYCINGECSLLLRSTGSTASRTGPTPACPAATCPGTASPASATPATPWRTPASTPGGWTSPSHTSATTPASTPTATAATRATRPPRSTRPVLDYWQVTTGAITRC